MINKKVLILTILSLLVIGVTINSALALNNDDVVSYHTFDNVLTDSVNSSFDCTGLSGYTYDTAIINNGYKTTDTGQYADCGSNIFGSVSEFSISQWIYSSDVTAKATMSSRIDGGGLSYYSFLTSGATWTVQLEGVNYDDTTVLSTNTWYHLVWTYSDSDDRTLLYINGDLKQNLSNTNSLVFSSSENWWIGRNPGAANQDFVGIVDEVAMFNTALTPAEVSELYNSGAGEQYPFTPSVTFNNFSTVSTGSFTFDTPVSIGNTWGVINSVTGTSTNASVPYYFSSVVTTNASSGSTASCRISVDGTVLRTESRTLSAGTLGNLKIITTPVNLTVGNHTVTTECRKTGGANYEVTNSEVVFVHLNDDKINTPIEYISFNSTGSYTVTTTPTVLDTFSFTTGNTTNTTNVPSIVVHGRASYVYGSTDTITTYLVNDDTGEVCGNYSRYGTAGTGSVGTACLFDDLDPNTQYNFSFYGYSATATQSLNNLLMNIYEIQTNTTAKNQTEVVYSVPNGSETTVANVTITNILGGTYNVFVDSGFMVTGNATEDAYFYLKNTDSSIKYYRTLSTAGAGNINTMHVFSESGTSAQTYELIAYCPSGCEITSGDLTAFVTDADTASTGTFDINAYNSYNNTILTTFNVTIGGTTYTTSNGTVTAFGQGTINVTVSAENFFSNTTSHDTTTDLNSSLTKYTEVRAYEYSTNNPITNFSLNTYNTTSGVLYLPTDNDTWTLGGESLANYNYTIPKTQYYNVTAYTQNSVNIYIYDQDDSSTITENMTIIVSGESTEDTYTTVTGNYYVENLIDGVYSVKVSGGNYSEVTYIITVASDSYQVLNTYLSLTTSQVLLTIKDFDNEAVLIDATVNMARFINNSWVTVASKLSDITGRVQLEYVNSIKYRFTITKDGYDNNVFYLDPILFSTYNVLLSKTSAIPTDTDYLSIIISYQPENFYNNESNNFTWLINSPDGSLEYYNLSIDYGTTIGFNGISANGESFNTVFTPTSDTVTINYCYDITLGNERCFKKVYRVIGAYDDASMLALKDNTFGLGLFERLLISTIFALFVAGIIAGVAGSIAGAGVGMLLFGFFTFTGFIPLWAILPSVLVGIVIIFGRSD